jgi:hypothetical protein
MEMENPTTRGPIENAAKRAGALAEKFGQPRGINRLHCECSTDGRTL